MGRFSDDPVEDFLKGRDWVDGLFSGKNLQSINHNFGRRFSDDPTEDFLIGQAWVEYVMNGGDPLISDTAFVAMWRVGNI